MVVVVACERARPRARCFGEEDCACHFDVRAHFMLECAGVSTCPMMVVCMPALRVLVKVGVVEEVGGWVCFENRVRCLVACELAGDGSVDLCGLTAAVEKAPVC